MNNFSPFLGRAGSKSGTLCNHKIGGTFESLMMENPMLI